MVAHVFSLLTSNCCMHCNQSRVEYLLETPKGSHSPTQYLVMLDNEFKAANLHVVRYTRAPTRAARNSFIQ